jgi:two-component system response regulator MprA
MASSTGAAAAGEIAVEAAKGTLRFADLVLDPTTREAWRGGRPMELTRTEFALLELFMRNPRQVLTRQLIFDRVWCFDFGPRSNVLSVYIGYLRRKTEAGGEPRLIRTVRGVGYQLCDPTDPAQPGGTADAAPYATLS